LPASCVDDVLDGVIVVVGGGPGESIRIEPTSAAGSAVQLNA
jgi:hypothetical protein